MKIKLLWLIAFLSSLHFAMAQKTITFNKKTIEVPEIVWAEHFFADNNRREEIYVAIDDINILTQTIITYNSNNKIEAIYINTINLNQLDIGRTYIQPIDRSAYKTPLVYSVRIQPKQGYKVMQRYMLGYDTEWQKATEDVGQLYANLEVIAKSLLSKIEQVKPIE